MIASIRTQSPDGPAGSDSLERCALQAQLRGDPMLGTAFPANRVLMVEQPGPWGHGGLTESQFDRGVAQRLEKSMGGRGVRVLAIRSPGRAVAKTVRKWGFADCRPERERLFWGTFDDDHELSSLDIDAEQPATSVNAGVVDDRPVYLVCSHSKHDICCALRGRPVAAGLHVSRPGRVWECSHLGGERFAANVLVLPLGLLYGRVPAFAAPRFAAEIEHGHVLAAYLRGRVGFAPAEQAAYIFAHTLFELARVGEVEVLDSQRRSPADTVVRLRTPQGIFEVTVALEKSEPSLLTCHATEPSRVIIYRPIAVAREPAQV